MDFQKIEHAEFGIKVLFEDNLIKKIDRIEYKNIDTKQKMEYIRKCTKEYIDNRCK